MNYPPQMPCHAKSSWNMISTPWNTRQRCIYFVDFFYWGVFNCSISPVSVLFQRPNKLLAAQIFVDLHNFKMHCVSAYSLSSDSYKSDTKMLWANYARKPVSIFLKWLQNYWRKTGIYFKTIFSIFSFKPIHRNYQNNNNWSVRISFSTTSHWWSVGKDKELVGPQDEICC